MQRWYFILPLVLVGCAKTAPPTERPVVFDPAPASALVFDLRLPAGDLPELDREPRQPMAFVGYEELLTTYFYLRVDDRQRTDGDRYDRRSYMQSLGVRYR